VFAGMNSYIHQCIIFRAPGKGRNMKKVYIYIEDPNIHSIYEKETDTLYISLNPRAKEGIIYIK